eukprot:scaffold575_cov242-Pinguiococcus_pyrenoidosus.AAC.4
MEMDHVHCLAAFSGDNCHLLSFKSPEKHVGHLVDKLEALGVGINFGTIDVLELLSTQPRITTYGEPENNKVSGFWTAEARAAPLGGLTHVDCPSAEEKVPVE